MNKGTRMRTWQIRYRIPHTANPIQETTVQASNAVTARQVFERVYRGCKISSQPSEVREKR